MRESIDKRENKNKKAKKAARDTTDETAAFETFALAGGKKNPKSGTTIPSEDGVASAKAFVEENKK